MSATSLPTPDRTSVLRHALAPDVSLPADPGERKAPPKSLSMVRVDRIRTGVWQVTLPEDPVRPEHRERVTCESLDDARRLAHECAERYTCELVVFDAYHRVLQRERFEARAG
jgi:hypothetical protein